MKRNRLFYVLNAVTTVLARLVLLSCSASVELPQEVLAIQNKLPEQIDYQIHVHPMHKYDPVVTFIQTGNQIGGRPLMGSWMSYGLGSENRNLPAFVVLLSKARSDDYPLYTKLWSNEFISSTH